MKASKSPIGRLPASPRNTCAGCLLNDGKAEHGAEQRERQKSDACRHRAKRCERRDAQRHRHHLRHRDPVDAVEKIDGVDEPDGAEHEQRPLEQQGQQIGEQPQVSRQARHHDERGERLADEAPRHRQRARIVGEPEHRQAQGGGEQRAEAPSRPPAPATRAQAAAQMISSASMTPTPAPCGVARTCEERSLGWARRWRTSTGLRK